MSGDTIVLLLCVTFLSIFFSMFIIAAVNSPGGKSSDSRNYSTSSSYDAWYGGGYNGGSHCDSGSSFDGGGCDGGGF